MVIEIIIYIFVGIISGLLVGLLGIGGGIIIVPSLFFLFKFIDISIPSLMHVAIGTSLATITITSIIAMIFYQRRHAIFWPIFKYLNFFLIIGAFLGVLFSYFLTSRSLSIIFAIFAFLFGIYFIFFKKIYRRTKKPEKILIMIAGLTIGFLASLLGIGGGVISIPFFIILLRVPNYSLVGSSTTATFITSIIGTISYLILNVDIVKKTPLIIGHIYLPAFFIISVVSIFSVSIGIKIADRIQLKTLKKIFGIVLIITSILMIFK